MDLRAQLDILRTRLRIIVACVLAAVVAAAALTALQSKVYEGRTTLIVGQSLTAANPDVNQITASQRLSQTYSQVATTRPILEAVIKDLQLPYTPEDLAKRVSSDAPQDSSLLAITALDGDANRAAAIANAMAKELIASSPTLQGQTTDVVSFVTTDLQATRAEIDAAQAEIERLNGDANRSAANDARLQTLESQLITLRSTYASLLAVATSSTTNHLSVVEPAVAAADPSSPKPILNIAVALILGLIVAIGLAFLVDYLDDVVKTPEEAESITRLPVVGAVQRMPVQPDRNRLYALATLVYPRSPAAESFRALRTNLDFMNLDAPVKRILVTSALPKEGKTTVAANLAVALAQSGRKTLLIDADLRRPDVHRLFDVDNSIGVTTLLRTDEADLETAVFATQEPNLHVLPAGAPPPNPAEVLASARMRALLERLGRTADVVVIDSAPLQLVTDAAILASLVDGTLLVVDAGRTTREAARTGREALGRVGARVLGVVLNRVSRSPATNEYYYSAGSRPSAMPEGRHRVDGGTRPLRSR